MTVIEGGVVIEGGIPRSLNPFATVRRVPSGTTIQSVVDVAEAGDIIAIEPGDYDEQLSIVTDNLTLIGLGARGAISIAPSAANGVAITIDGTGAGGRVEEVALINVGGEGNGTGGGLYVKGNIRRFRAYGCKLEGGAYGCKLESTGADPLTIGDVILTDCEFCWTEQGVVFDITGAGDPLTQLYFRDCWFHDCSESGMAAEADAQLNGIWVKDCMFNDDQSGVAPTGHYIDLNVAGSFGIVTGCRFELATNSNKNRVAAGIMWVANATEAGWSAERPTGS